MNLTAKLSIVVFLLLQPYHGANAAPDYPFEELLPRAETIFIGRITNHSEQAVTFEICELLRGHTEQKTITLRFYSLDDKRLPEAGSSYLVISQGDNHFGKPEAIVSLGQVLKGQAGYIGWIALPMKADDNSPYLDLIHTRVGQKPSGNPARLTLEKARELIQQIPYKPDLHGNGV